VRRPARSRDVLILTCEHGGNDIPRPYSHLFRGAKAQLESHRGWDPGALTLARHLAKALDRPLLAVTVSRLFVEANRSPTNRRIWSDFTKGLSREAPAHPRTLVAPAPAGRGGRGRFGSAAAGASCTSPCTASWSDGERNAEIGLLYDSRRQQEAIQPALGDSAASIRRCVR
jgi:predicted N-formylglutamate amidohydrolase